jgi:1-acyl-sn-glycerol-3-phosphate acyltransferase
MKGNERNPLLIFPEGATTNGEYLMKFKKGAFASLLPVQPYIANAHSMNISVSLNYSFFISSHSMPNKTLNIDLFPVFAPNEYFWKHHWEPNQDKEKKVDTYMRVVR